MGLSGRIIYEEGYAGETALLIRVPEKGLGGGGIIEARAGGILKFGSRRDSRKGKKKKAGAPSVQAGTEGGSRGWNFRGG